ncbi:hypothetical protein HUJ04_008235 [Dendroctonus ponderosae]|nr:hypothetical protein HUJ04_008235 [Dendroctonus ponderosae]
MFIVSGMTFVALMIYSLGFLKMEQVKIGKCNWTSYDMADSSINMKVLLINNRRVFRFIKHLDKSIRYVVLVDVLLNSISIAALATNITNVQRGDFVFCTGFLLMQVTQVFVLGWFANDIIMLVIKAAYSYMMLTQSYK